MAHARYLAVLFSLLSAIVLSGCAGEETPPPPLQATASSAVGCKAGQSYQHTTLGYHLCFPGGWTTRDYTAEPGSRSAEALILLGSWAAEDSDSSRAGAVAENLDEQDAP